MKNGDMTNDPCLCGIGWILYSWWYDRGISRIYASTGAILLIRTQWLVPISILVRFKSPSWLLLVLTNIDMENTPFLDHGFPKSHFFLLKSSISETSVAPLFPNFLVSPFHVWWNHRFFVGWLTIFVISLAKAKKTGWLFQSHPSEPY